MMHKTKYKIQKSVLSAQQKNKFFDLVFNYIELLISDRRMNLT